MALYHAPSFDALERLSRTRDSDLVHRALADEEEVRGRGAQSNRPGRFEREEREPVDDGWGRVEPLKARFETVEHIERARSIIARNDSPDIPFDRSINPYRGCEHGCAYCFARPTHAYVGHSAGLEFERELYVKVNAAELLRQELADKRYKVKPIAIGTNTDPYQPIERKNRIMRQVLEVLLETRHPVTICTKSALVLRDMDLLVELNRHNLVSVALSITSLDHKLSRRLEPRASSPERRLEALRVLSAAGIPTRVMAAPMIPAINDMELERILDAAAAQGASAAGMVLLRLNGEVRDVFREWLLRFYPDRMRHVLSLVRETRDGKDYDASWGKRMAGEGVYATLLQQRFQKARERYGLDKPSEPLRCDLFVPPKAETAQMSLF